MLGNTGIKSENRHIVRLFPNIQFVYELHMATLELTQLSNRCSLLPDFRSFSINGSSDVGRILKRSAYAETVDDQPSDYARFTKRNITRAFNQYITHWFYPYKGKYHPQMVRGLANIMGLQEGSTLLDPFVGSGTTGVEASLLGIKAICYDISPLCVLITKIKVNAIYHLSEIAKERDDFFVSEQLPETATPEMIKALSDPVRSFNLLARMIAISDQARRGRDFYNRLVENRKKMLRSLYLMKEGCEELGIKPVPADIQVADARHLPLPDQSIDGIITSPPYSLALNYVENDAHALEALGYDLDRIKEEFIGVRGTGRKRYDLYEEDMVKAYSEMARVLRPHGKAAVVLGNSTINGEEIGTVDNCIHTMDSLGLELIYKIDKLIYGLYNVMQHEWILVFEKR